MFSGEVKQTAGEVTFPVYAEGVKMSTKFLVVDCDSSYNMILGLPLTHGMGTALDHEYSRSCNQTTLKGKTKVL